MENFTVYVHTFPNGKKYVGITNQTVGSRWRTGGKGYKGQELIWNAIVKYGWENIEHEIIIENVNQEIAEIIEIGLIAKYRSDEREYGYNVESGGNWHKFVLTEEQRERQRQKARENLARNRYPKSLTENEVIEKLKTIRPDWEYISGYNGYRGRINIRCKNCGIEKNISADFCLDKSAGRIRCNCTKIQYHKISELNRQRLNEAVCKRVAQFTKDGEFINEYNSIKEASERTGVNLCGIGAVANGKRKSAGKYIWRFI